MRRIILIVQLLVFLGFLACKEKKEEMVGKTVVDEIVSDTIDNLSFEDPIEDLVDEDPINDLPLEDPREDPVEIVSLAELDDLLLRYRSEISGYFSDVPVEGRKGTMEDIELLQDYLGKWLELNHGNVFGPIDEYYVNANAFIEIFFIEGVCVFKHKYAGDQIMGYVYITEYGTLCLKGNAWLPYFIVGKPFESEGKPTILIDCEGPVGFYQLE